MNTIPPKPFPPLSPVDPLEKAVRQAFASRIEAMPDEFLYGPEFNRADHTPVDADPTWRKNLIIAFYPFAFELLDPSTMEWEDAPPCEDFGPPFAVFSFWACPYASTTNLVWVKTAILQRLNPTRWAFRLLVGDFSPKGISHDRYWRVRYMWENDYGDLLPDLDLQEG